MLSSSSSSTVEYLLMFKVVFHSRPHYYYRWIVDYFIYLKNNVILQLISVSCRCLTNKTYFFNYKKLIAKFQIIFLWSLKKVQNKFLGGFFLCHQVQYLGAWGQYFGPASGASIWRKVIFKKPFTLFRFLFDVFYNRLCFIILTSFLLLCVFTLVKRRSELWPIARKVSDPGGSCCG